MRPEIVFVALDEAEFWTLPEGWADAIDFIGGVYAFNRNVHVHVASTVASYEMRSFGPTVHIARALADNDPHAYEVMHDYFDDNADRSEPVTYMNVSEIDRTIAGISPEAGRVLVAGDPYPEMSFDTEDDEDRYWRRVEQDQASNPWLY